MKKYMLVDLVMLIVIGCILEFFMTKISGIVLNAAPTFTFAFLLTFVAVVRWNLYGLAVIPFLLLANWIGGMYNDLPYLAAIYDWKLFVSSCIGMATLGVNVIFYKKFKTKKVVNNLYSFVGVILLNLVLYDVVFSLLYRTMTSGNPFVMGSIPFDAMLYNPEKDELELTIVNLCYYVENASMYNIFGAAVAFIGAFILRSQGVVNNVVDKLIDDKKDLIELRNAEHFEVPMEELDQSEEKTNQEDL